MRADVSEEASPLWDLVPVENSLWVCRLWVNPGSALVWAEAGLWVYFWHLMGVAPTQGWLNPVCYRTMATW